MNYTPHQPPTRTHAEKNSPSSFTPNRFLATYHTKHQLRANRGGRRAHLDRVKLRARGKHVVVPVVLPGCVGAEHGPEVVVGDEFFVLRANEVSEREGRDVSVCSGRGEHREERSGVVSALHYTYIPEPSAHLHDEIPPLFLAPRTLHLALVELAQGIGRRELGKGLAEVEEEGVVELCELEF